MIVFRFVLIFQVEAGEAEIVEFVENFAEIVDFNVFQRVRAQIFADFVMAFHRRDKFLICRGVNAVVAAADNFG